MNAFRILVNGLIAALCFSGGIYLIWTGEYFLRGRWQPQAGSFFSGLSLYLLAFGLFFLGSFAAAVALAWIKGTLPVPESHFRGPHPTYKGKIIVRFWYLVLPAFGLVLLAFALAQKVPSGTAPPYSHRQVIQTVAVMPASTATADPNHVHVSHQPDRLSSQQEKRTTA